MALVSYFVTTVAMWMLTNLTPWGVCAEVCVCVCRDCVCYTFMCAAMLFWSEMAVLMIAIWESEINVVFCIERYTYLETVY